MAIKFVLSLDLVDGGSPFSPFFKFFISFILICWLPCNYFLDSGCYLSNLMWLWKLKYKTALFACCISHYKYVSGKCPSEPSNTSGMYRCFILDKRDASWFSINTNEFFFFSSFRVVCICSHVRRNQLKGGSCNQHWWDKPLCWSLMRISAQSIIIFLLSVKIK